MAAPNNPTLYIENRGIRYYAPDCFNTLLPLRSARFGHLAGGVGFEGAGDILYSESVMEVCLYVEAIRKYNFDILSHSARLHARLSVALGLRGVADRVHRGTSYPLTTIACSNSPSLGHWIA